MALRSNHVCRAFILITILALGPGLAACGGGDEPSTGPVADVGEPDVVTGDGGGGDVTGADGDAATNPDGAPTDGTVTGDGDATVVDPDAVADGDAAVDPDGTSTADGDGTTTSDADGGTTDPDADGSTGPDIVIDPCDPNPCVAGEGQDFLCDGLVATEYEYNGECKPSEAAPLGYECTQVVKTTVDCQDVANCPDGECGDYPGKSDCYDGYCTDQIGCSFIDNFTCKEDPCVEQGVVCDEGTACDNPKCVVDAEGIASCDYSEQINCDDANGCTIDSCDPDVGCVNEQTEGCVSCFEDADCEGQSDACSAGQCDTLTGSCIFDAAVVCDDGNPCSEDLCDPDHEPTYCAADDDCPGSTCQANGVCAGSDNPCFYQAVPNCPSQCKFNFECDDWNGCTDNVCEKENPGDIFGECVYPDKDCDDGSECTVDGCDEATGKCVYGEASCEDLNPCTVDSCGAGSCNHTPVNCNDNDPTTEDFCLEFDGSCVHKIKDCPTEDPCLIGSPNPVTGECEFKLKNGIPEAEGGCDDGNACTEDVCYPENGACVHLLVECEGTFCQPLYCDQAAGGCLPDLANAPCNDDDLCTNDICNDAGDGSCTYQPTSVDDFNYCTNDSCNSETGAPLAEPISCDDGDPCTTDSCVSFNPQPCKHVAVDCNDFDACTQDVCLAEPDGNGNDYTCSFDVGTCDDGNPCTIDSCNASGVCTHVQKESLTVAEGGCIDDDVCTTSTCDATWMEAMPEQPGTCLNTETPCFTDEECIVEGSPDVIPCVGVQAAVPAQWVGSGECTSANPCADADPCTVDVCTPVGDGVNFNCPGGDDVLCPDDSNACTTDLCNQDSGCYAPVQCNDNNDCTIDYCNPVLGCVFEGGDCDDGNPCTQDTCGPEGCINTLIVCNDNNPCTVDSCAVEAAPGIAAGECQFDTIECDDGDACTVDQCFQEEVNSDNCAELGGDVLCFATATAENFVLPAGVCFFQSYADLYCNDGDNCTNDECVNEADAVAGTPFSCDNSEVDCDDDNACTSEQCQPGYGCVYDLAFCDDGDPCTIDECDVETGCTHTVNECDDGNECTIDACNPGSGICETQPVDCYAELGISETNLCTQVGCDAFKGCQSSGVCDDLNACTSVDGTEGGPDGCNEATGECTATQEVVCDDGDECTVDICNAQEGCKTVAKCLDGNECTIEECNNDPTSIQYGECSQSDKDCDDGNPCTLDGCEPETGECTHEVIVCESTSACFTGTCNPENGICEQASICDDGNTCTIDECNEDSIDPATGLPVCSYQVIDCDDENACTVDSCEVSGDGLAGEFDCIHEQMTAEDCDDGEFCTIDFCDLIVGDCVHEPNLCDDDDACTIDFCESGACDHVVNSFDAECVVPCFDASECDDGNLCTVDSCDVDQGICINAAKACDDGNECTLDGCNIDDGSCYYDDLLCASDDNPCTTDSCNPSVGCTYAPINCIPASLCQIGACNVDSGECEFGPAECDDSDPCTTDVCDPNTGACVFQKTDCDDGTICTVDVCDPDTGVCVYEEEDCGGSDACAEAYCDPTEGCLVTPQIDCSDDDPCTEDKCDTELGCIAPNFCDDENPCTIDLCDADDLDAEGAPACTADFDTCDDGDPCTYDFCQPGEGCVNNIIASCNMACTSNAECNDGESCTADSCTDDGAGGGKCTYGPSGTCNDNEECTFDMCVPGLGCVNELILGCGQLCTVDDDCTDTGICNVVFCQPVGDGSASICKEETVDCNDDEPCTLDQCDDTANPPGCTQNDIEDCGDPFPCDSDAVCETDWPPAQSDQQSPCVKPHCGSDSFCTLIVGGCDDGDPCTVDSCNQQGTECTYEPIENCVAE